VIGSVVVLYNPTEDEIKNINSYIPNVDRAVIVDNSVQNNEKIVELLINDKSKIQYFSKQENMGLCKALNIGIKLLEESGCDWALLFDADSKLGSDIVTEYKKAIEDYKGKQVALFTPVHVFDRSNAVPYSGYKNVDWSMTSGWLINIEIFEKQNGFFEELFVDGLDMDYCFKSHENGYLVIECGKAVINHHPAETRNCLGFKYGIASPYRYYMQARQLIWCWKRYKKTRIFFVYLYKWAKVLLLFDHKIDYIKSMAKGTSDDVFMLGKLAAFQIQNLLVAYKERFDKDNFIKNLLLDNLLRVDMYTRAENLHIETDVKRVVYIIETKHEKDTNALETIRTLFASRTRDFITAVDEKSIILVREVKPNETYEDLDKTAEVVIDMLNTEAMSSAHIAYGTIVNDIREVSRSYKEANMALDVGKIFYSDKNVVAYNRLGIGRLIYQLPLPLCQMFIREIFDGKSPDDLDDETLSTINKFFDNSLNVSETSRQLYIHRNTLVYRLDKLQKTTGLDLRVFDDAITFKIALMVVKYMKYMESKDTY